MKTKTDKISEWSIDDTILVTPWAKAGIYFDLVTNEATGFFTSIKLGSSNIQQHIASENIIEKHLATTTDAPEMVHAMESISFIIETYHHAYNQVNNAKRLVEIVSELETSLSDRTKNKKRKKMEETEDNSLQEFLDLIEHSVEGESTITVVELEREQIAEVLETTTLEKHKERFEKVKIILEEMRTKQQAICDHIVQACFAAGIVDSKSSHTTKEISDGIWKKPSKDGRVLVSVLRRVTCLRMYFSSYI